MKRWWITLTIMAAFAAGCGDEKNKSRLEQVPDAIDKGNLPNVNLGDKCAPEEFIPFCKDASTAVYCGRYDEKIITETCSKNDCIKIIGQPRAGCAQDGAQCTVPGSAVVACEADRGYFWRHTTGCFAASDGEGYYMPLREPCASSCINGNCDVQKCDDNFKSSCKGDATLNCEHGYVVMEDCTDWAWGFYTCRVDQNMAHCTAKLEPCDRDTFIDTCTDKSTYVYCHYYGKYIDKATCSNNDCIEIAGYGPYCAEYLQTCSEVGETMGVCDTSGSHQGLGTFTCRPADDGKNYMVSTEYNTCATPCRNGTCEIEEKCDNSYVERCEDNIMYFCLSEGHVGLYDCRDMDKFEDGFVYECEMHNGQASCRPQYDDF